MLPAGVYIQDLFEGQDWRAIAGVLEQSFGVQVDPNALHKSCFPFYDPSTIKPVNTIGFGIWTDSTWLMFFKKRLCELGLFPHGSEMRDPYHVTASMHFFFTHLEETPEMLIRLKKSEFKQLDTLARSKIVSYMEKKD